MIYLMNVTHDIKYKCVDTIKNTKKHGIVCNFCKVHKDAV